MNEQEILKQLKYYVKLWRKGGFITPYLAKSLYNLLFYKDWTIAGIPTKSTRQRAWLIKTVGKCVKCGSTKNLTQDHIHPKSKGGVNGLWNKQLLCSKCNTRKGNTVGDNSLAH